MPEHVDPARTELRPAPEPVRVTLQPENRELELPRVKIVRQLLERLGARPCSALVIRDGGLLTPDRRLAPGDRVIVRLVVSSG